jgi:uncharacterized membrane protein
MSIENDNTTEIDTVTKLVRRLHWFVSLGIVTTVILFSFFIYQFHNIPFAEKTAEWGQFGDYIGGLLNPTFSFLALIALITTLRVQITELKNSAQELKISSQALVGQNETMRKQAFEATFFQLLRLHNDIVLSLETTSGNNKHRKGRACFASYSNYFKATLRFTVLEQFYEEYNAFHSNTQSTLDHYFRLLYQIMKLIHQTDNLDKHFYANLVRAQLSSDELELLFYNGASQWGCKFKPLIEEYALLKHIPNINPHGNFSMNATRILTTRYSPNAFGGHYPEWSVEPTATPT